MNIYGGTVKAKGGTQAAGIGSGYGSGDVNTVNISDNAKVTATGDVTCMGIAGSVNISGGLAFCFLVNP